MSRVQLDPSLIGRGDPVNAFQNAFSNGLKIRAMQQEGDVNDYKLQEAQAEAGRQNALAGLLSQQGFNPASAEGASQMYGAGGVKNTQAFMKNQAEIMKDKSVSEKAAIENQFKKFELMGQLMGGVNDQSTFDMMKQQASQIPELADFVPKMPQVYDPAIIAAGRQKAMSVKDSLAARHQELVLAETGRHNVANETNTVRGQDRQSFDNAESRNVTMRGQDRQSADSAASRAVTMRGQNMTDARSRESNSSAMSKPFEVTGEDGKPVLVRQDKAGNISRVEGFAPKSGAEKPMTDAQSKAALFGSRMESSNSIINDLAGKGTTTSIPFSRSGLGVGDTINALSSGNQQQLTQAKRDFINAVLRRESGAVISDTEFANAERQYFPQVGESEKQKAQKANARAIATRGIQAEIPKGQRNVVKEIIGGSASNIDSLLDKYK